MTTEEIAQYLQGLLDEDLANEDRWFQGSALRARRGAPHRGSDEPVSCLVSNRDQNMPTEVREVVHQHLPDHTCSFRGYSNICCLIEFNNNADSFEDIRLLLKTALHDLEEL